MVDIVADARIDATPCLCAPRHISILLVPKNVCGDVLVQEPCAWLSGISLLLFLKKLHELVKPVSNLRNIKQLVVFRHHSLNSTVLKTIREENLPALTAY